MSLLVFNKSMLVASSNYYTEMLYLRHTSLQRMLDLAQYRERIWSERGLKLSTAAVLKETSADRERDTCREI